MYINSFQKYSHLPSTRHNIYYNMKRKKENDLKHLNIYSTKSKMFTKEVNKLSPAEQIHIIKKLINQL